MRALPKPKPSVFCPPRSVHESISLPGKQWKPQCAKSPQFLATDRFWTSYSVHPSTSFARVYPSFVETSRFLLFSLSEMGESIHFACLCNSVYVVLQSAEHTTRTMSSVWGAFFVCTVCAASVHCAQCAQCSKPHYGSFRIPGGTGSTRQPDWLYVTSPDHQTHIKDNHVSFKITSKPPSSDDQHKEKHFDENVNLMFPSLLSLLVVEKYL